MRNPKGCNRLLDPAVIRELERPGRAVRRGWSTVVLSGQFGESVSACLDVVGLRCGIAVWLLSSCAVDGGA
jgi:hypothetical protein